MVGRKRSETSAGVRFVAISAFGYRVEQDGADIGTVERVLMHGTWAADNDRGYHAEWATRGGAVQGLIEMACRGKR